MSAYLAAKFVHLACLTLSIAGFAARFVLVRQKSALVTRRWMRVLPHVNDTLLLAAAIVLMVMSGQYPFVEPWLTAKVFGLITYIVLGSIALRAGRSEGERLAAALAALVVFAYIVSVALSRDARGMFAAVAGF